MEVTKEMLHGVYKYQELKKKQQRNAYRETTCSDTGHGTQDLIFVFLVLTPK